MERIVTERTNQGKLSVSFVIDNNRYYDEALNLIEKDDEFTFF